MAENIFLKASYRLEFNNTNGRKATFLQNAMKAIIVEKWLAQGTYESVSNC